MADELKRLVARNVSDGPKILNATPPVVLQAGEATDRAILISDAELENAKLYEWFEFEVKAAAKAEKAKPE